MTQQVIYSGSQVMQWQDTETLSYAAPPSGVEVLAVTPEQWAQQESLKWVVGGALTATEPPKPAPPLAQVQASQTAVISTACAAAIVDGFSSSALGEPHTYPADQVSQINLMASVTASLLPGLAAGWTTGVMCEDASGVWAIAPHTAAQVQQAGIDGKAFITAQRVKNATLAAQIAAATTVAAVQLIKW